VLRAFETDQLFNPDDCCGKLPDLARHAQQRNLNPKLCDTTVVYETVENGICEGRFTDHVMPCVDGQLAGDQR
jgi:hypothetical protein